jgi:hypothetical protein
MAVLNAVSIAEIKARGSIKDADVLKLRRNYYDDGSISAEEADMIFTLNDACPVQDPAWADCFVETITDYLVEQAEPQGYLTVSNAEWLMQRISRDGKVDSKTGLDLLVNILDKARWSPQNLVRFALDQVKEAVLTGSGPLRSGKAIEPRVVTEADAALLRRILFAAGSDGSIGVTRTEAEVLFEIDALTIAGDNHPAWTDLYVKAIVNCMMAASGYAPPPRGVALAREAWLERRGDLSLDAILGNMTGNLNGLFGGYREQTVEERAIAQLTQQKVEIITREAIALADIAWLVERIGRDGTLSANERALVAFLKAEAPTLDPALQQLVDRSSVLMQEVCAG